MSPYQKRLNTARGLLIFGLLLLLLAHCFPLGVIWFNRSELDLCSFADGYLQALFNPFDPGSFREVYLGSYWLAIVGALGSVGPRTTVGFVLIVGAGFFVAALPFLVHLFSRARALRWLALIILVLVATAVVEFINIRWGILATSGSHLLLAGFWFLLLGLLFIPDAQPGARLPWKVPLTLALLFAFLLTAPRFFSGHVDRILAQHRLDQCRHSIYGISSKMMDFERASGRFPTLREGWQPLISAPAPIPWSRTRPRTASDGRPEPVQLWHPFLTRIPLDP